MQRPSDASWTPWTAVDVVMEGYGEASRTAKRKDPEHGGSDYPLPFVDPDPRFPGVGVRLGTWEEDRSKRRKPFAGSRHTVSPTR